MWTSCLLFFSHQAQRSNQQIVADLFGATTSDMLSTETCSTLDVEESEMDRGPTPLPLHFQVEHFHHMFLSSGECHVGRRFWYKLYFYI